MQDALNSIRVDPRIANIIGRVERVSKKIDIEEIQREILRYGQIDVPLLDPNKKSIRRANQTIQEWAARLSRLGLVYSRLTIAYTEINILCQRAKTYIYDKEAFTKFRNNETREAALWGILKEPLTLLERMRGVYEMIERISKDLTSSRQAVQVQQENLRVIGSSIRAGK